MPKGKSNPLLRLYVLDETEEFLIELATWYEFNNNGPNAGALLFNDGRTFREHLISLLDKWR